MKKYLFIVLAFICMGWGVMETPLPPKKASKTWRWHANGSFRYPSSYLRSEVFVDDVPASVEVFSNGNYVYATGHCLERGLLLVNSLKKEYGSVLRRK